MTTVREAFTTHATSLVSQANNDLQAAQLLPAVETPEGWHVSTYCYARYVDISYTAPADADWHTTARHIAAVRKAYSFELKFKRSVSTYRDSATNRYEGSYTIPVSYDSTMRATVSISTGLPPSCKIEVTATKRRKTVTEYTSKVVCS